MVSKRVNEIYARHLELQKKRFQNALSVKLSKNSSKERIASTPLQNQTPPVQDTQVPPTKKTKLKLHPKQINVNKPGKVRKMSIIESRNIKVENESSQDVQKQQSQGPRSDLGKSIEPRVPTPDTPSRSPSVRIKRGGNKSPKLKKVKKV